MTEQPRYLVVEVVPDLAAERTTRSALFAGIAHLAGVHCVYEFTDLTGLTTKELQQQLRSERKVARRR